MNQLSINPVIKLYITLFLFFSSNIQLTAQSVYTIEHLTEQEGLSHGCISCILQDSRGYLWIGTEDGLNRYDGYTMKEFVHNPQDSNSISNNFIRTLFEDPADSGRVLWIGTKGGGLNKFDLESEKFIHYLPDPANSNSISHNEVKCIFKDNYGDYWIGTEGGGLNRFHRESEEFTVYKHDDKFIFSLSNDTVSSICGDKSGNLWIATQRGLNKLKLGISGNKYFSKDISDSVINKPDSISFQHYLIENKVEFKLSSLVYSVYKDRFENIWIGTPGGIGKYFKDEDRFIKYVIDPKFGDLLKNQIVWSIYEDRQSNLWIATHGVGLIMINKNRSNYYLYKKITSNPNSLSANSISSIFQDKSGIIWVGTYCAGINKLIPHINKFTDFHDISGYNTNFSEYVVSSFFQDSNNNILIGTILGGIHKLDLEKQKIVQIHGSKIHKITSICKSKTGEIWLSGRPCLTKIHPITGKYNIYNTNISSEAIYVYEDTQGIVWCVLRHGDGTLGGKIYQFDLKSGQFKPYKIYTNELVSDAITVIFEDKSGTHWFGSNRHGLIQSIRTESIDQEKGENKFIQHRADINNSQSVSNNIINTIYESNIGDLWIGTQNGLNKFDTYTNTFISFHKKDGLPSNDIRSIEEDNSGNIWISTINGLSKFDTNNDIFINYNISDGLQANLFMPRSSYKNKEGQLFFGGINGFNIFYPDNISYNRIIPTIVITDFKIFNKSIVPNIDSTLKKSISVSNEVKLDYKQSVFSFEFAVLDYHSPQNNKFAYKMIGVDPDWVYTDALHRYATYTNLDAGEYIFKVKGSNNDGVWNDEAVTVNIIITPPWWKTWWLKSIMGILIVSVLVGGYTKRISSLRKKHRAQKEFSRNLIDSQELERKRIASELHDSHGQNLLILSNELQQYILYNKNSEKELKPLLDTLNGSINEIRNISYDLHPHPIDKLGLKDAVETLISRIENTIETKFKLQIGNIDGLFSKKVEINLYRIIQEAINNIIKHSKASQVKIDIKREYDSVTISISDNGIGFDEKQPQKKEEGLGLMSIKARAMLIGANLNINSKPGVGTIIRITNRCALSSTFGTSRDQ